MSQEHGKMFVMAIHHLEWNAEFILLTMHETSVKLVLTIDDTEDLWLMLQLPLCPTFAFTLSSSRAHHRDRCLSSWARPHFLPYHLLTSLLKFSFTF